MPSIVVINAAAIAMRQTTAIANTEKSFISAKWDVMSKAERAKPIENSTVITTKSSKKNHTESGRGVSTDWTFAVELSGGVYGFSCISEILNFLVWGSAERAA